MMIIIFWDGVISQKMIIIELYTVIYNYYESFLHFDDDKSTYTFDLVNSGPSH
jgi:hypothetical protein